MKYGALPPISPKDSRLSDAGGCGLTLRRGFDTFLSSQKGLLNFLVPILLTEVQIISEPFFVVIMVRLLYPVFDQNGMKGLRNVLCDQHIGTYRVFCISFKILGYRPNRP